MKKKKLLLVHPEVSRTKFNFKGIIENEPVELEYIQAIYEEKGYDVKIFDIVVEIKR